MTANLFSRRRLMMAAGTGLLASPTFALPLKKGHVAPATAPVTVGPPTVSQVVVEAPLAPEQAMARLMAGNARYVAAKATRPNSDAQRRTLVAGGQKPFATILACADSRVAPELIFDQGLGDLFVVRVAGNVVDDAVLASIEHSVIHLGSTLVMVLGHERCDVITAAAEALDGHPSDADKDTKMGALAALIAPAVQAVPVGAPDKIDAAVSLNASHAAVEIFAGSKPLRSRVLSGRLKIVAARYDLDEGKVAPARARAEI